MTSFDCVEKEIQIVCGESSSSERQNSGLEFPAETEMKNYLMKHVCSLFSVAKVTKFDHEVRQGMPLKQYSLKDVSKHSDSNSCWIVVSDKVYDVTQFINDHPGGEEIILENAGCDATVPFISKGHSADAYMLIEKYCIGELIEADRRTKK